MPLELARLNEEDLINFDTAEEYKQDLTTRASSNAGMPIIEMIDDLEASMSHRGKAFKESRVSTKFYDNDKSIMGS